jgi:hypothetical protein
MLWNTQNSNQCVMFLNPIRLDGVTSTRTCSIRCSTQPALDRPQQSCASVLLHRVIEICELLDGRVVVDDEVGLDPVDMFAVVNTPIRPNFYSNSPSLPH